MSKTATVTKTMKGSRIGKLPVALPANVTATVENGLVSVKGPKGSLTKSFPANAVKITLQENAVVVQPANNSRLARAMHGTARAIIFNMVKGVVDGFSKNLEISGVGFRATLKEKVLDLAIGYSHPTQYTIPEGITVTVTDNTKIKVEGADKHLVGQVAADIFHCRKVEPYKGKGIRIEGQFVRRKEGKKTS